MNRTVRTLIAIPLIATAAAVCAPFALAQRGNAGNATIIVRNATVIDGTGAPARPHTSILIEAGKITRVADSVTSTSPRLTTIDGTGLFVIPGLVDGHVHVGTMPWAQEIAQLKRAVEGGVTGVWDLAGDTRVNGALSVAVLKGEIIGPSVYYSALMAGPSFFSDPRVQAAQIGYASGMAPWMQSIGDTTNIPLAVARARGTGATSIKIYAALDSTLVTRIIAEANRQGIRTVAHATVFPARPSDLVNAGVTMMAHALYLVWDGSARSDSFQLRGKGDFLHVPPDGAAIGKILALMKSHGTFLNPTLWVFSQGNPATDSVVRVRTPWLYAVTRRAAAMGIPMVAGTDGLFGDAPRDTMPTLHEELRLMVVEGGLTPMQALMSATSNSARAIGVDKTVGTIEAGKNADLVLLTANPLDDITNTRRIKTVIKSGRIVP